MRKPLFQASSTRGSAFMRHRFLVLLLPLGFALAAEPGEHVPFTPEQISFFTTRVQPLLVQHCYSCHGGGEANAAGHVKVKSGLQLISRRGLLQGGEHGPAFSSAQPLESLFLKAVSYDDDHLKMPPKGKLADADRQILQDWAQQGLPWTVEDENKSVAAAEDIGVQKKGPENTWTYEPLHPLTPPKIDGASHPIDAFLLEKLTSQHLRFSPSAPPVALIRRAYYDLTGLPPTPEQVSAFVNSKDPQVFAKLTDELLARPQYGEKYARYWLDLVRYAESNGYERDNLKGEIWRYRQWVIDSLNADKPYDAFVREQIAGDELDSVTTDSLLATGYWNLMQWDDEPADRLQHSYDVLDDNVRVTGEAFLGMTLGCARCHNHKADPILQKDYYSFMAFMHGLTPYSGDGRIRDLTQSEQRLGKLPPRGKFPSPNERTFDQEMTSLLVKFQQSARQRFFKEKQVPLPPDLDKVLLPDSRTRPQTWDYTLTKPSDQWPEPGYNPEEQADWKQGPAGFGRAKSIPGGMVRTEWITPHIWLRGYFQLTEIPTALNLTIYHDEDVEIYLNGRMIKQLRGFLRDYVTLPLDSDALAALQTGKNVLAIHVLETGGGQFIDAGLSVGDASIADLMAQRGTEIFPPKQLERYVKLLKKQAPEPEAVPVDPQALRAQIAVEQGTNPPDLFIHLRGNPHVLGEKVGPAFPVVFKSPEAAPVARPNSSGRRRTLADWLASPQNPRTARVIVNRVWQWHFGRGLCASSSDWGKLGSGVTHPELIDWLAADFIAHGWSLKYLHRLIMSSHAYQQAARYGPDLPTSDPTNSLWWRFDMRRLSSEEIRDSILAVSGNLNLATGGESFFAELPAEVLATSSHGASAWGTSPPDQVTRRSIYLRSKRSIANPLLTDFDQADTDNPCPVRFATTVPTQALNFLNSKFLDDQAHVLAQRLSQAHPGDLPAQLTHGLSLVLQRPPRPAEVAELVKLHATNLDTHHTGPDTALARVCLVLLNLNEFVYLD